jgi:hypothetical protein
MTMSKAHKLMRNLPFSLPSSRRKLLATGDS